jgi:hypothetical protein
VVPEARVEDSKFVLIDDEHALPVSGELLGARLCTTGKHLLPRKMMVRGEKELPGVAPNTAASECKNAQATAGAHLDFVHHKM